MSPAGSASASDLTVEQYAGISAAMAEGYPLDAVLANEGLAPKAWPDEDTAWKQKLVAEPATFESYRLKLGEAEDWLGRKVTPLDEDLVAWMGFLGAYTAHPAPFVLLDGLGLKMGDLGRLQRRWQKRLTTDAELAKQAAEVAKQKPNAVPSISAAKGVLRPFPWSKSGAPTKAAASAPDAETSAAEGDFDLASYAALAAQLAVTPEERRRLLRRHGLDEPAMAALKAQWDARIASDAALAQDYRRLFAHQRARSESAARSGKELPRVEAPAPVAAFAAHPDLMPIDAPLAAEMTSIVAVAAPAHAPSKLAGTALAVDVPRGPALPFARGIAPQAITEGALDELRPQPSKLGGTALAVDAPRRAATPFELENKSIPASPPAPPPPPEAPRAAPSKLAGTSLVVEVPHGPALPFDPSAAPSPAIAIAIANAIAAPRAPAGLGGTSLLVDVPRGAALPFAKSDPRSKKAETAAEPLPPIAPDAPQRKKLGELKFGMEIPKNLPPPRSVYAPPLTLEQHASLAVELATSPETTTEILARYRLTPEARAELDAHYHDKIAGSAELRAAWDRAYHAYSTWLAANRRSAR
jgi:hypothetical protein